MKVAIVYHFLPHYRRPVTSALDQSPEASFVFYASDEAMEGIVPLDASQLRNFESAPFRFFGPLMWQPKAISAALHRPAFDAIIFLANPHFLSTWVAALVARLRGIPVLFWGHGWLKPEPWHKRLIRNLFFRLANRIMVYAERGARLGVEAGYPAERIAVIHNSLDVAAADEIFAKIESGALNTIEPRNFFANPDRPLIICTARLTRLCRFDLLIAAAQTLAAKGSPINILLVGDGPEAQPLAELAQKCGVDVHFMGALYDETILGQLIYKSDLTVSPGKIGLTAMHSLMYGTPAITHDNLDDQMPEVEALTPGVTGALYHQGDSKDLAEILRIWLDSEQDRASIRQACRDEIHDRWTPDHQTKIILQVLSEVCPSAHPTRQ